MRTKEGLAEGGVCGKKWTSSLETEEEDEQGMDGMVSKTEIEVDKCGEVG